jgi:hypothetical protein
MSNLTENFGFRKELSSDIQVREALKHALPIIDEKLQEALDNTVAGGDVTGTPNRIALFDDNGDLSDSEVHRILDTGGMEQFFEHQADNVNYTSLSRVQVNIEPGVTPENGFIALHTFIQKIDEDQSGEDWTGGSQALGVYSYHFSDSEIGSIENLGMGMQLGDSVGGAAQYVNLVSSYININPGYTCQGAGIFSTWGQVEGTVENGFTGFDCSTNTSAGSSVGYYSPFRSTPNLNGDIESFIGSELGPTFNGSFSYVDAYRTNPVFNVDGESFTGFSVSPSGSGTLDFCTGFRANLNNVVLSSGRPQTFDGQGGAFTNFFGTKSASNLFFDTVHNHITQLTIDEELTGTELLMNNSSSLVFFSESYTSGFLGLGLVSTLSGGQIGGTNAAATVDRLTGYASGISINELSTAGTVGVAMSFRSAGVFNLGAGVLDVEKVVHFQVDPANPTTLGTSRWGFRVEDAEADNFLAKSLTIGGVSQQTSNEDVALELAEKKAMKFTPMTEAERDALTAEEGMVVYVRDGATYGLSVYNGTIWEMI